MLVAVPVAVLHVVLKTSAGETKILENAILSLFYLISRVFEESALFPFQKGTKERDFQRRTIARRCDRSGTERGFENARL